MSNESRFLEKVVRDEGVIGSVVSFALAVGVAAIRAAFADDRRS